MFKQGEQMTRLCKRKRSETYIAIHDFTIWSDCFDTHPDVPDYIQSLLGYLSVMFVDGVPERDSSPSGLPKLELEVETFETDLVPHAKNSNYFGWEKQQHPIVLRYLRENDPFTIATEVPVFDDDKNGFMDILRIHEDYTIEVADFKPKAKKDKKAASQIYYYREMLQKMLNIPPEKLIATYFDHEDAFILKGA